MKVIKYNKKLVNNVILGSSLFGSSAGIIITTVQGTSTPPNQEQDVHQYNKEATEQLRRSLARPETSLKECIELVQFQNADPNIQVGLFTLLEEVVLTRSGLSVKPLIDKGADIYRVTGYREVKDTDSVGRTLLHLAVYSPPMARKFLLQHKQEKEKLQGKPRERPTPEETKKCSLLIGPYIEYIQSEDELFAPEDEVVKELLDSGLDVNMICMKESPSGDSVSGDAAYDLVNRDLEGLSNPKLNSRFLPKIKEQYKKIKDLFDKECGFSKGEGIREWRIDQRRKYPHAYPFLMNINKKDGFGPVDFSRVH